MAHIEERALRALEEHPLACPPGVADEAPAVGSKGGQPLRCGGKLRGEGLDGHLGAAQPAQRGVAIGHDGLKPVEETSGLEKVADADAAAADHVFVAGPDAAARGANLGVAARRLAPEVDVAVVGHDDVGIEVDAKLRGRHADTACGQRIELTKEHIAVDDHAAGDDADLIGVQDARRQQVQNRLLRPVAPVDHQRVAGVVSALIPHDEVALLGKEVDHFALPFIAPLGTHYDTGWHGSLHGW